MHLVLIGYRGTGKSVVGKVLAEKLGWPLLNFDQILVDRAGKSIPEIVEDSGWEHFRDLESAVVRDCARKDQHVFDTGGGCILRQENIKELKESGTVFWLQAPVETIADRIRTDDQRPSLTGKDFVEEISEVLEQRAPLYALAADYEIKTGQRTPEEIAGEILSKLG